jgi:predicted RNA methylase
MKEISRRVGLRGRNWDSTPCHREKQSGFGAFLSFREDGDATSVLDPCAGAGAAMATITSGAKTLTYGIELDSFRAEEARLILGHVLQGNCFCVQSAVESFSLLYENPPYDSR